MSTKAPAWLPGQKVIAVAPGGHYVANGGHQWAEGMVVRELGRIDGVRSYDVAFDGGGVFARREWEIHPVPFTAGRDWWGGAA